MFDISEYGEQAKFDLPGSEREAVSGLAEMLSESFKELEMVNTDAVPPLVTVLNVTNVFREDKAEKFLRREELQSGAADWRDGYFSVPKILV